MKKLGTFLLFCLLAAGCFYAGTLAADRQILSDRWIRIHVVAATDDQADQNLKLQVRNGLLSQLRTQLEGLDPDQAVRSLEDSLPRLEERAGEILRSCGSSDSARVTLEKEAFPERSGDGFRLPAGVYRTLRITIGEGRGHNWWGVLYPDLWQTSSVSTALTGENRPVRFFFLEKLGRLQSWWRKEHSVQ